MYLTHFYESATIWEAFFFSMLGLQKLLPWFTMWLPLPAQAWRETAWRYVYKWYFRILFWTKHILCQRHARTTAVVLTLNWHKGAPRWVEFTATSIYHGSYSTISDTTQSSLGPQIIFKKFQKGWADIRNSCIFAHIGKQVNENTGFKQIWSYFNQNIELSWKKSRRDEHSGD